MNDFYTSWVKTVKKERKDLEESMKRQCMYKFIWMSLTKVP